MSAYVLNIVKLDSNLKSQKLSFDWNLPSDKTLMIF